MYSQAIPQANPLAQYLAHKHEIDAAVMSTLAGGRYILGSHVQQFESEFAAYIGVKCAVGLASGTDALVIALKTLGIGPGDEVITTPHTAVATVAAIELAGAKPVLVDIEPDTFLIDPTRIEAAISRSTRAIIPVHLFGQPAEVDSILKIAQRYGLRVVEDCAQAHGARFQGRRVGSWGDIGCFSFYPTKNLGAIGDGGMIVTNNEAIADRVRMLREYGWTQRFVSEIAGASSRLDELQAAILRVKLRFLDADNERRRQIADYYTNALGSQGFPLVTPVVKEDRDSVFHLYVVRTADRDAFQQYLKEHNVGTTVHYPAPIHLQPAYRGRLGDAGSFPVAERAAHEILSLPLFPELSSTDVQRVTGLIQDHFQTHLTGVSTTWE